MGDSDDDSMNQRREKFQRERDPRSDQYERRGRNRDWNPRERSRGGWNGGQAASNSRPMAASPGDRRRPIDYPPHMDMKRRMSPPAYMDERNRKRIRPHNDHYDYSWQPPSSWGPPARPHYDPRSDFGPPGGPPPSMDHSNGNQMLTFKKWLLDQSDDISDEDAIANYNSYKINYRQQQLQTFFLAHKNEEWFKEKYHPDDAKKRFNDQRTSILWRVEVFKKLLDGGVVEKTSLDLENDKQIVKLLDSAVILMEGGTFEDFKILDEEQKEGEEDKAENKAVDKGAGDATKKEKGDDFEKYNEEEGEVGGDDAPPGLEETSPPDVADKIKKEKGDDEPMELGETGDNDKDAKTEEGEVKKPRALHRTHSIFMRNLPPFITKQEIVNLCKEYPGFVRVAFSLQDSNRFLRRCWVTFNRDVDIKDICWKLNKIRVRDAELNPVVNRDLVRRIRAVSGITQHASCARNDLRNIARLINHLDDKWKLWQQTTDDSTDEAKNNNEGVQIKKEKESGNPWLENISQYLVDESSAEEEELLGASTMDAEPKEEGEADKDKKDKDEEPCTITRDDELIKVLDRLLYYLRIVHSVDYYNASEYYCEDEMPNRCGIVHARGPIPPNLLTKKDIDEFQERFSKRLALILNFKEKLTDEEAQKLGPKNEETEIEKFIEANTQELEKDKWLCPLSGKKFKGREYIRKHINNKHKPKLDQVRNEVKFFNNYLYDPRRPSPAESQPQSKGPSNGPQHAPNTPQYGGPRYSGMNPAAYRNPRAGQYGPPRNAGGPPGGYNGGPRSYGPRRDNGGGRDPRARQRMSYHDLDAPHDEDEF